MGEDEVDEVEAVEPQVEMSKAEKDTRMGQMDNIVSERPEPVRLILRMLCKHTRNSADVTCWQFLHCLHDTRGCIVAHALVQDNLAQLLSARNLPSCE